MSEDKFVTRLKEKNPDFDVDKMLRIFDERIADIQASQGLDEIRLPLDCDLNKALIASIISELLKE